MASNRKKRPNSNSEKNDEDKDNGGELGLSLVITSKVNAPKKNFANFEKRRFSNRQFSIG